MKLLLIRHGITDWNLEKRIQGRTDQPLSDQGIRDMRACELPSSLQLMKWYCSPLLRARQSAELMGLHEAEPQDALVEMHWGEWEGEVLKPLRKKLGQPMRDNEARGLDFRPPGGESPRDVQDRLLGWIQSRRGRHSECGAVVHKGIIRCAYALARDWDMSGESPIEFDWSAAHEFRVRDDGTLSEHYRSIKLR